MIDTRTLDERMKDAREGRRVRPYYLVFNFSRVYNSMALSSTFPEFTYLFPEKGAKRDLPVYAGMSNIAASVIANIFREVYTGDGRSIRRLFADPQRSALIMGDAKIGASRVAPAEWFYPPQPLIVREGETLGVLLQRSTAPIAAVSDYRAIFLSEIIYRDDEEDGRLTADEEAEIAEQIRTRRQRTFIVALDVDLSSNAKSVNVALPELDDWAYILGFASVPTTGSPTVVLEDCYVEVNDPNGEDWTNDGEKILISALASLPFDANNTQASPYRELATPYLVGPRRESPTFTFTQGAVAETTGKLLVYLRTA